MVGVGKGLCPTTSWWERSEMGKQLALEGHHLSNKTKLAPGREEESRECGVLELKVGKHSLIEKGADHEEGEVCEKKEQELRGYLEEEAGWESGFNR